MALTKAQVSLVTVATIGAAPGGFTADLMNFGSQKEVANLIATLGTPEFTTFTNAEFALQVAKNLGVSAGDKAVTEFFNKLEAGATRAEAAVDFANGQLVAQGGSIANVNAAIASNSTSTDLNELTKAVSSTDSALTVKFTDSEDNKTSTNPNSTNETIYNVGKAELDAGAGKISADYTFELKNQIGEKDTFSGMFLSPVIDRQSASSTGSQLFLELLDLRASTDGKTPLERVPVDTFAFSLNGSQILVQSDAIYQATTYQQLFDAVKARVEELGNGVDVPAFNSDGTTPADAAAYAKLAGFTVEQGSQFTVTNQAGDDVSGTQIVLNDTGGATLAPQGFVNKAGVIPDPGYTLYAQMNNVPPTTVTKLITTNLDADNVGYGSQGASVNLAGQSASDKGVEEIKVLATNNVWFTKLESKAKTDHLARIELKSGSEGYFRVGTQENSPNHVVSLVNQDFRKGGLVDVQQVAAGAAGSTAINSFVSSNVLGRYDFKDTGIYTADDTKAAITYNLSSGQDVLNLAIDTQVLAAVDTKVKVDTGAGDDVITVMATNGLGMDGKAQAVTTGGSWLVNQQLNNNIVIDAGAGNDWILTPGAGNATIFAGAGNDVVRVDNTGDRAVFVFNNDTSDISILSQGLTSNSDNGLSSGANGTAQTFDFYKAVVKVTFKGFESKYITIDSTNYTTNTKQINQAIKKAINDDAVLKTLIAAHENDGNALAIESLIDGTLDLTDLVIDIQGPAAYSAVDTDIAAAKAAGKVMLSNGEAAKADAAYAADGKTSTTATIDTTTAEGLYDTEFGTLPGGIPAVPGAGATASLDASGFDFANAITVTFDGTEVLASATYADADALATAIQNLGMVTTATNTTGTIAIQFNPTANGAANPVIAVRATNVDGTVAAAGVAGVDATTGSTAVIDTTTLSLGVGSETTVDLGNGVTIAAAEYANAAALATAIQGHADVATALEAAGVITITFVDVDAAANDPARPVSVSNVLVDENAGTAGSTGTAAIASDIAGTDSLAESDNVIDLGTGQDVLVLGTGAESNDTVVFKGYNLGEKTIVNFTTAATTGTSGQGVDLLDFTSYLNSVDANKAVINNTVASDFSTTNGVTLVDFTAGTNTVNNTGTVAYLTFDELTEANVKLLLNNADAAGDISSVSGLSATAANNNVLMVQSNTNAGEYKAFHVTTGVNSATADVKLIGTFDFGDADITGLATVDLV